MTGIIEDRGAGTGQRIRESGNLLFKTRLVEISVSSVTSKPRPRKICATLVASLIGFFRGLTDV